ncbi:ARM repeat-containing protein [Imleria badia]|nr:ARM repeat-containing protein [Imleria badia]
MSQQAAASKPSLQGVKIKARKGAVKAQAKHEPSVFRDQLYKHLETVPDYDFDTFAAKLVQAGSTLEFLKYADALFEIILVGGLIQPGGSYIDDGAPTSPFTVFKAKDPASVEDLRKYVEVLNKLIRRYKYLQKPLEEQTLPSLLQYINRWSPDQRDKLAITIGLLLSQGIAGTACLQSLTKDQLVKNDASVAVVALIFRAYLTDQSMDHLAAALKRGNIKDLLLFFPPNRRDAKILDDFFRKQGLPQVAEWYTKKQYALAKVGIVAELKNIAGHEESAEIIISAIHSKLEEQSLPDTELIQCIWQGLMASVDWSAARPDQIEGLALREVGKISPILEAFCKGPKIEVALINQVQVHCYEDTRIMRAFPQILKASIFCYVLYNKDCISDQAIIYWYQKGSKPQGRQHFLKSAEALVKFLQEQDSDEEDE